MHRDLVVIGASAGGIEALQEILAGLPGNFPAAVLIAIHTSGHIYVAPPDYHTLVQGNVLGVPDNTEQDARVLRELLTQVGEAIAN